MTEKITTVLDPTFNYVVDINNKGLELLIWTNELVDEALNVPQGVSRGWQITGELLFKLQDETKFPDIEVLNITQNLTNTATLTDVRLIEKPKRTKIDEKIG